MIRLHVTAEGQTEKAFIDQVLTPHLARFGVYTDARCVLTSKDKRASMEYRGGLISYQKAKADIETWMKEDAHPECWFTSMFDLYALPADFPGFNEARPLAPYERIERLEVSFGNDLGKPHFIPYIQLHEFESLILADPSKLDWEYLEHEQPIGNLVNMVGTKNPELINDGQETAPSKRILKEIPEYDKVTSGVSVAAHIGLDTLRASCKHFAEWVSRLEKLGGME
ncbi:DUF4276 family protein [Ectothiorhodospira sp. 9100]|uniref:DUF4276 family protein n=1 Tax=unclassified Ectothiorhodospira TaxID=2684909 RepID=UPI001EE7B737|nr:DUF4276 family protein [Ectothiorhodospira sp. 9100]MCG5518072.1 DUF4276 family protein [Ectothiorhodospira sp. 9905]